MRILLDTHAFLWFYWDDPRLGAMARSLIEDPLNVVMLSLVSCWEMAIKCRIGKLDLGGPFELIVPQEISASRMQVLPITFTHIQQTVDLPLHHREPFDRLLIAQALVEGVPFLSNEQLFDQYTGLDRRW